MSRRNLSPAAVRVVAERVSATGGIRRSSRARETVLEVQAMEGEEDGETRTGHGGLEIGKIAEVQEREGRQLPPTLNLSTPPYTRV